MNRHIFFALFATALLLSIGGLGSCKSVSGPGENCNTSIDCEKGLYCLRNLCQVRKVYEIVDNEPIQDKRSEHPSQDQGGPKDAGTENTQDNPSPDSSRPDQPKQDRLPIDSTPRDPGQIDTTPNDKGNPDTPRPDLPPGTLTVYDLSDPQSPRRPNPGSSIEIKDIVVTTPSVRLSSTLNAFFVQATQQRQGSFKYSGLMVVYNKTNLTVALSPGTLVALKGTFVDYRSIDWNNKCTMDSDCVAQASRKKCLEVNNTQTSQKEFHCTEPHSMPQIELSAAPTSNGSSPIPAPVLVKPIDVYTNGTMGQEYRGVLLKVENVKVTSANPDQPKDYSEFAVTDTATNQGSLRVDDMINTISYTGSKYCGGCSSKPDDSYCLPGDKCNCTGSTGRCHTGTAQTDSRTVGDEFDFIIGVLRYANGDFKLLPRLPTDIKRK